MHRLITDKDKDKESVCASADGNLEGIVDAGSRESKVYVGQQRLQISACVFSTITYMKCKNKKIVLKKDDFIYRYDKELCSVLQKLAIQQLAD